MRNIILKPWAKICASLSLALLVGHAQAQSVATIGGGYSAAPFAGYQDGHTLQARFNQPMGLAMDPAGNYMFVADFGNNSIRIITLPGNTTASATLTFTNTFYTNVTRGISHPVAVAVDGVTNIYVLNRGGGTNGTLLEYNAAYLGYPTFVATNASRLTNATAMTMDGLTNLYITVSNTVLRITLPNTVSVVGKIAAPGANLQGIAILDNGQLALSDAGTNSGIWMMNPNNGAATQLAGFHGTGDNSDIWPVPASVAIFNHPGNIAKAGNGMLVITDESNNRIKLLNYVAGTVTLLEGVSTSNWGNPSYPGWVDGASGTVTGDAESRQPFGVVVAPDGSVFASEEYYDVLRHVTGSGLTAPQTSFPPYFNNPAGIAFDSVDNYLFIADFSNNDLRLLDLNDNTTSTFLSAADGLQNPVSVLVDSADNIYVLNQGTPGNGFIEQYDIYGNDYGPVVTGLNQPTAFLLDGYSTFFVTEQSGNIRAYGTSVSGTIATVSTNANVSLQGIALFDDGTLAVSDSGNDVIWTVNPITKQVTRLTGQIGITGTAVGTNRFAQLNQPRQLTRVGGNQIVAADSGNNRMVLVSRYGTVSTNHLNSLSAVEWFGNMYDPVANNSVRFVPMVSPNGVAIGGGVVFVSEPPYSDIRGMSGTTLGAAANPGVPLPIYFNPAGIALNNEGTALFVADPGNDSVDVLNFANNQTTVFLTSTNGLNEPVDVALDSSDNLYVLNQGTGGNGSIIEFDKYGNLIATNAGSLAMPTAMRLDFFGNFFVAELNGMVQEFNSTGSNTLAVIATNANVQLQGIAVLDNGIVVVSDPGNQVLWQIPAGATNANATLFTGVFGTPGSNFGSAGTAKLNNPMRLAQASGGLLLVADSGNNRVVVVDDSGTISKSLNSTNADLWFGLPIDPVTSSSINFAPMVAPVGLAIGNNGTVYDSETGYKVIRGMLSTGISAPVPPPPAPLNLVASVSFGQVSLTWSPSVSATNYYVKRSPSTNGPFTLIGVTSATSFADTGLNGGSTWYYVVSAINTGGESPNSAEVSATLPYPPVTDPVIGYVTFPPPSFLSVFTPVSSSVTLNNDASIVIVSATGTQTYYTYANTNDINGVPDPTSSSGSAPAGYMDGLGSVSGYAVATILPSLSVKAISEQTNHPNSAIASAQFLFVVGNPNITGNNAAAFTISDITLGSQLFYTTDGSDPSSNNPAATMLAPLTGTNTYWTVSFPLATNTVFKAIAYKSNYQPSGIVSNVFTISGFQPSSISFGFASGEASSDFVASPGQTFYAPVTLNTLPNTVMYSLQFDIVATNAGPNPGPALAPNSFDFESMMLKPDPSNPGLFIPILPLMFIGANSPPVGGNLVTYEGTNFVSLMNVDTALNLMTLGWVERITQTNLYNTLSQDLIKYSMAHDDLFLEGGNKIIVGGYAFQVPANAVSNQTYQIQIIRPSATSDGIGAPGSDVYISAPTNGATAGGAPVNALKYVTVGQRKYIAGSVYPFRWFNAGDFGSSNIVNADVEQVFQSAIYQLNYPPFGSDFFDGMDSCGSYGVVDNDPADPNFGYYTNSTVAASTAVLFDGNDTTINQVAFGDGVLDVCDVYVTFRRSLDPSLTWFRRFWNNGQRVADTGAINMANHGLMIPHGLNTSSTAPQVNFSAGDVVGSAGQTIQIPINATILGNFPLRVLMLNLTVTPLDGSPALTTAVSFNQTATTLGTPYSTSSQDNGNFAAVWLNSTNAGLTGTVTLGTLSVTIPSNASGTAAYAIHFDHASASPNGLASFPNQKLTGLLTTTSPTNSSYGDGIPDSWRLRWFGTINNILSSSNACPSGDGVPNWKKYVAGVDPNVANDFPSVKSKAQVPPGSTTAIHWPSVQGKQYVIQRSITLFGTPWTILSTNTGTGGDMEFDDNSTANSKFYRVEILP